MHIERDRLLDAFMAATEVLARTGPSELRIDFARISHEGWMRAPRGSVIEQCRVAYDAFCKVLGQEDVEPGRPGLDAVALMDMAALTGSVWADTKDERMLESAQVVFRWVVFSSWRAEQDLPIILAAAGNALLAQAERETGPDAAVLLDAASRMALDATGTAQAPDSRRPAALELLGTVRRRSHERFGATASLVEAIRADSEATELTAAQPRNDPRSHVDYDRRSAALGRDLLLSYRRTRTRRTLDEAVAAYRSAADDQAELINAVGLADALVARAELTADATDAAEALRRLQPALGLPPGTAAPEVEAAAVVAWAHGQRVLLRLAGDDGDDVRDGEDLGTVATRLRAVAARRDLATGWRAQVQSELAATLDERFVRTGNSDALDEAIALCRVALDAPWPRVTDRYLPRQRLATALHHRFRRHGDLDALDEAVATYRAALGEAGFDLFGRFTVQVLLAEALHDRWSARESSTADASEAGMLAEEIVAFVPADSPAHTSLLDSAVALLDVLVREHVHGPPAATDRARDRQRGQRVTMVVESAPNGEWRQIARNEGEPLGVRCLAARRWGASAYASGDLATAVDAYRMSVRVLTRLAPDELRRDDQEHELSEFTGLASDAASVLLRHHGDPAEALELLERGRGVLFAQQLALRQGPPMGRLNTTKDGLAALVGQDVAVVLNVSDFGSDALLVSSYGGVETVRLPEVTRQVVDDHAESFRIAQEILVGARFEAAERAMAAELMDRTLEWLWDAIAHPVFEPLGLNLRLPDDPADPPPLRLWWIPTGALSFLPLHAAGYHRHPGAMTALDRLVSSYAPTLQALIHARAALRSPAATPERPLVVAMAHHAGSPDLPAATREADMLSERYPQARLLVDGDATRGHVLDALPEADLVHFACHGLSRLDHPSASYLQLADGPLSVLDIHRLSTSRPSQLAYLSACSTARGGAALADEAIHIASAFQLAGFPHVVGTLWPIADQVALSLATQVYGQLSTAPGGPAVALRSAARRERDRNLGRRAYLWAAYVHMGP